MRMRPCQLLLEKRDSVAQIQTTVPTINQFGSEVRLRFPHDLQPPGSVFGVARAGAYEPAKAFPHAHAGVGAPKSDPAMPSPAERISLRGLALLAAQS